MSSLHKRQLPSLQLIHYLKLLVVASEIKPVFVGQSITQVDGASYILINIKKKKWKFEQNII